MKGIFIKLKSIIRKILLIVNNKKISNNNILNLYNKLHLDLSNEGIIQDLRNQLSISNISPSEISKNFNNFLHTDICIERFSVHNMLLKINDKIKFHLKNNPEINQTYRKKFKHLKEINLVCHSVSFLAYNLNLALIYSIFNIKVNLYFFYFGRNFFTKIDETLDETNNKILLNEIKLCSKSFKLIKIIYVKNMKPNILSKDLREKIKLVSAKSILAYDQILSVHKVKKYKEISHKIKNKSFLKKTHIEHFKFASRIIRFINNDQLWINHNSNIGINGVLHELLEYKKASYTSHEYRGENLSNDKNHQIMILNQKPVLSFSLDIDEINNFIESADDKIISEGAKLIDERFKQNFSKKELTKFLSKNKIIDKKDKNKIFIFYSNILSESRYQYQEHHPIFSDFKDFFFSLLDFFKESNLLLIIKCHPTEFNLRHKFDENLKSLYDQCKNKNSILIYDDYFSSYSLSEITDNIIVYDSDIGAEMIYKNKKVISGGNPRYKYFNIGKLPKNRDEFFSQIIEMSEQKNYRNNETEKNQLLSSLFFFYYLNKKFDEIPFKYGDSTNQLFNCDLKELFPKINNDNNPAIIKLCL